MGYRWHDDAFRAAESRIEDLMLEVADLDAQLIEKTERGDEAERLLVNCWWAFREIDQEAAEKFRDDNAEGMGMFL